MISALKQKFQNGEPIPLLLRDYSQSINQLLIHAWGSNGLEQESDLALLATGGLARDELFPYSDVDLLILHQEPISETVRKKLNTFFDQLWNAGLKPTYSVRDFIYCINLAKEHIRVMTALIEAVHIIGNNNLFAQLRGCINIIWKKDIFKQTLQETIQKNYQMFPLHSLHIKNSPGGLRNMQMLKWLWLQSPIPIHIDKALNDSYIYLLECRMAMHLAAGYKRDFFNEEIGNKLVALRKGLKVDALILTQTLSKQNNCINEIIENN